MDYHGRSYNKKQFTCAADNACISNWPLIPIVFIYCADGCHCERSEAISLPFVFEIATATLGGLAMTVRRYY